MRHVGTLVATAIALITSFAATVAPTLACAGLIGSNGAVNLGRTTTLAAYHDGVEHYVTAFEFLGGGGQFGTLIPLPGIPSSVEKGGSWTLQRLALETAPRRRAFDAALEAAPAASGVQVLLETRVDALDLTVLKGGARDVAAWAIDHGFSLSQTLQRFWTFTREGARSSSPLCSMATRPRPAASAWATGRRSKSPSQRRTHGFRCASWDSANSRATAWTRTYFCSPTIAQRSSP